MLSVIVLLRISKLWEARRVCILFSHVEKNRKALNYFFVSVFKTVLPGGKVETNSMDFCTGMPCPENQGITLLYTFFDLK